MKPGSCTLPLHGIDTVVLDPMTGKIIEGNDVEGVLALRSPWPGIARTCLGDHDRYLTTYFRPYPGYYFTGDAVRRDKDGYYFITGRVDDVLNVSGKLLSCAFVDVQVRYRTLQGRRQPRYCNTPDYFRTSQWRL